MNKKPLYKTWSAIKRRCFNPNVKDYKWYGAKGVSVCAEWKDNYQAFESWCLANNWTPGMVVSRNNDIGDYSPDNCTIKTKSQNASETKITEVRRKSVSKEVICLETQIVYSSTYEASKQTKIPNATISHNARHKCKAHKGKYTWRYIK